MPDCQGGISRSGWDSLAVLPVGSYLAPSVGQTNAGTLLAPIKEVPGRQVGVLNPYWWQVCVIRIVASILQTLQGKKSTVEVQLIELD
eukprot:1156094-Pelagomonas_calceolata.AAC.11